NLEHVDETMADLDLVPNQSRKQKVRHALCNGFGFGGVNAALLVSKVG
ncbi:MAG: beta-ketoacyl-ACP synthase II, partial [Candidatus Thiodiazotropha sp.]